MFLINFLTLLAFAGAYILAEKFGMDWIKIVPGTLLLYYLPGHNLNSVLFSKRQKVEWYVRLPLDILASISVLSIIYLIIRNSLNLLEFNLVSFIIIINVILAIVSIFYDKTKINLKNISFKYITLNKHFLIILFIPIIFFVIRLILNPYVYDIDSLHYFVAYNNIIRTGIDNGSLFAGRDAAPFLIASSHYVAGWNYIGYFKIFTPLILYITSIISLSLVKDKNSSLANLSVLMILSSPMLIIMNEEVRPETLNIAFTIPTLTLIYLGTKKNDNLYIIMAFLFAVLSFRFHELGFILLLSSMLALLINIVRNFKAIIRFVSKKYKVLLLALPPYFLLLKAYPETISAFTQKGMTSKFISVATEGLKNMTWDWWFLDNATTFVGGKIGWPGLSAIYYYLYHGIIILLSALFLFIIYLIIKRNRAMTLNYLAILPLFIFFFIHFSIAEVLPRLGVVLLFDRSWPYISAAGAIFSIILVGEIVQYKTSNTVRKVIAIVVFLSIMSGVIGATIGSTFMGAMVSSYEKRAIKIIKKLPKDSIIISTQRNHNLVQIYGNKDFFQIKRGDYTAEGFALEAKGNFDDLIKLQRDGVVNSIIVKKTSANNIEYYDLANTQSNNVLIENTEKTIIEDPNQKLLLLSQYYPDIFNLINRRLEQLNNFSNRDVYFLYSFAKLDHGILNTRPWWKESNDVDGYQFFKDYDNKENIVAKDENFILIKVN